MAANKLVQARQRLQALGQGFREGLPGRLDELRAQGALECPVIFISVRNGFDVRLQTARIGSDGYLPKRLDIPDSVESLEHFSDRSKEMAYRVLAVDDDEDLVAWYRQILTSAGFDVETVTDYMSFATMTRSCSETVARRAGGC